MKAKIRVYRPENPRQTDAAGKTLHNVVDYKDTTMYQMHLPVMFFPRRLSLRSRPIRPSEYTEELP